MAFLLTLFIGLLKGYRDPLLYDFTDRIYTNTKEPISTIEGINEYFNNIYKKQIVFFEE